MYDSNIAFHLSRMAEQQPNLTAIAWPNKKDGSDSFSYQEISYADLEAYSNRLVAGLKNYGIVKRTKTIVMVSPSLEFFGLIFALFKIGAIPIMLDPGMGRQNLKKCIENAGPSAFIGIPKAHVARILFRWGKKTLKHFITVGSNGPWAGKTLKQVELLNQSGSFMPRSKPSPQDTAAILFTSGSTGTPKGAVYTHSNFNAQLKALKKEFAISPGEVDLCTFPLFSLFAPALGMTAVVPKMDFSKPAEVNPEYIFSAIKQFSVNNLFGSPALVKRIAESGLKQQLKLNTIKRVISCGAPVPPEALEQLKQILPDNTPIYTPYGATEALPISNISSEEILIETAEGTKNGEGVCVGRPVDDVEVFIIRITDDPITIWSDDYPLPAGTVGEIVVKGPQVTREYLNNAHGSRVGKIYDPKRRHTLHRMGDLGYFDAKGRLWFCGRKSHRVRNHKETHFTMPVEGIFNKHQKVMRTALVGVGEPKDQKPILCVELDDKELDGSHLEKIRKELIQIGASHPKSEGINTVLFHKGFPVDPRHNSKILREKLGKWAETELKH